jgi:hypothetical protein
MACLMTLASGQGWARLFLRPRQVFLVLIESAQFVMLAPIVLKNILFMSAAIYSPSGTDI